MLTRRCTLAGGAPAIGKRLAVIGEGLGDPEGSRLEEIDQAAPGTGGRFFGQDVDRYPTGGAVADGEEAAALILIRQLRQVLDVDMHQVRGIVLA